MPALGNLLHLFWRGQLALAVGLADRDAYSQVANRQHVRPLQREDEEHVPCPVANSFDLGKRGDNLGIAHRWQRGKVHLALRGALSQVADVGNLLLGKSAFTQFRQTHLQDRFRGQFAARSLLEAIKNRPRDRKSTRLNSSHSQISYAVFCLKKKKWPVRRAVRRHKRLSVLGVLGPKPD